MNRPRNRQPRPSGGNNSGRGRGGSGGRGGGTGHRAPCTPQQAAGTVPTIRHVIPGAAVFIILKEDQPTGRETRGVVAEVLTSGNHPRGIKVRLRGGVVGRVQRLDSTLGDDSENHGEETTSSRNPSTNAEPAPTRGVGTARFSHRYTDVRNDEYLQGPPERSLADFLPADFGISVASKSRESTAPTVNCPICENFAGDEAAVTHHIEQNHLG